MEGLTTWVSSLWGTPAPPSELRQPLIDPTENRIGTIASRERLIWNPEISAGPVVEPQAVEMTGPTGPELGEEEWTMGPVQELPEEEWTIGPVEELPDLPDPPGVELTDMAPQRAPELGDATNMQRVELPPTEESVIWNPPPNPYDGVQMSDINPLTEQEQAIAQMEEKVDELLEPVLRHEYTAEEQDLIDFMEEEWGTDVRAELGSPAFEETLVRREVALEQDGFEEVNRLVSATEANEANIVDGGLSVMETSEFAEDVVAWSVIGWEVFSSLVTAGVTLGLTALGEYLINLSDEKHKEFLSAYGIDPTNMGIHSDEPGPDFPGRNVAAYVRLTDKLIMNCQIIWTYGDNPEIWIVRYRDLYNYLRQVMFHHSRIILPFGNKHVSDLTPEDWGSFRPHTFYKRDNKSSTWATRRWLRRYPLLPIGTRVKSIKTGRVGTIDTTYDHNGKDPASDEVPKNADKYGVHFDTGRTKHAFFRVDEFYVENPLTDKWQRLMGKINRLINADEPVQELIDTSQTSLANPVSDSWVINFNDDAPPQTLDPNLQQLMNPEGDNPGDETTIPTAFDSLGTGELVEREDADSDIEHIFLSDGKVITHDPEHRPTELHVGDRVKVVSGTVRVRAGEMHGTIVGRTSNNRFRVNLDKEGIEAGVHMIYGFDLAKELPNWSRYHDSKGRPLKKGDQLRHRGHTMEIGSFYKRADEYYARDPNENMSMMLSQSYLVVPEVISAETQAKIDTWGQEYDTKPILVPPPDPKVEYLVVPQRRRLMDDSEWWTARRFFYLTKTNKRRTALYDPKFERSDLKQDKFNIPLFEGLVCVDTTHPSWEMLNIFVEEINLTRDFDFKKSTRNRVAVNLSNDPVDQVALSYYDMFKQRKNNPLLPWNPDNPESEKIWIGTVESFETTPLWWWFRQMFEYPDEPLALYPQTDDRFIKMLYIVASSRDPDAWVNPNIATFEELKTRANNLHFFLDFCENKGNFTQIYDDIVKTYTYKRLKQEYEDVKYVLQQRWPNVVVAEGIAPPPLEVKHIDRSRQYRSSFKFDGTEIYWELIDLLPVPDELVYSNGYDALKDFISENWLPVFDDWSYYEPIEPNKFLVGKSAWQTGNRGVELDISDNKRFHLFMTPYNLTTENVNLLGLSTGRSRETLNRQDDRPGMFMTAYHEVVVETGWRPERINIPAALTSATQEIYRLPEPQPQVTQGKFDLVGPVLLLSITLAVIIYKTTS